MTKFRLRPAHVWGFLVLASLGAGSLPAGTVRYAGTLAVCLLGILGFTLARPRTTGRDVVPSFPPLAEYAQPAIVTREGGRPVGSVPRVERLERQASVVTAPTSTGLSGTVDAVDTAELMTLLGEQITGGSGDGVQLWASPTEDDDVLHVEFMDRTGAHVCLAVVAEGVVAGDD